MTTLRREIIQKIKQFDIPDDVVEPLADSILELRAFSNDQKAQILRNADPAWSILAGEKIDQGALDEAQTAEEARGAFERDMKFNPLPWGSTKAWEKLERFVIAEYQKDPMIFARYKSWQMNDGKYVAMKNNRIRSNPEEFVDNFPDFLAHTAMYGAKQERKLDNNDAPITY